MPTLQVVIRQHKFNVSCDKSDEAAMRTAAAVLEDKIKTLRQKNKVADGERAVLMAALQIAFDAHKTPPKTASSKSNAPPLSATAISALVARINGVLERTESSLQKRALSGVNQ